MQMTRDEAEGCRLVIPERLTEIINSRSLHRGSHDAGTEMCVMEAVAYIAGEPWSDHPKCVCPTISAFMRSWNDLLRSDAERDRLLKPLIPVVIGTRGSDALAEKRGYMALDWLVRVFTPKFLDLNPALGSHAKALRDAEEIADLAGAVAAGKLTAAARDAAGDAAGAAARDAARDAAGDAARAAAWAAAWAAATDAARAAAWAAATDAAGDKLQPTVEWCQASAQDLVRRMAEAA